MHTRGNSRIFKSKTYLTSEASNPHIEPKFMKTNFKIPHWHTTMQQEYADLINNNTWQLVHRHSNYNIIDCKWIFRVKHNSDGSISNHKARLVAKGFHQQEDLDFS